MEKLEYVERMGSNPPSSQSVLRYCYLCGKELSIEEKTIEDVIPRGLFVPESLYSNRVRLTACGSCNRKKGHDEEYVLSKISIASFNDPAKRRAEKYLQRYKTSGKPALGIDLLKKHTPLRLATPGGIYLGQGPGIRLNKSDQERITSFFRRIFQGIWIKHVDQIVDWGLYDLETVQFEQAVQSSSFLRGKDFSEIWKSPHGFGQSWAGVISYRIIPLEDKIPVAACIGLIVIYSSFIGVCFFSKRGLDIFQ